jgi:hypothetical protein
MYILLLYDKNPDTLRMLVSIILVFYIVKHGQTYLELEKHEK